MIFQTIGSSVKQAFKQVFRNRAMSFASLFSITAMLLILGVFFILAVNINMMTETAKSQFDTIQVYLEDSVTGAEMEAMKADLQEQEYVSAIELVTKEQALAEYKVKWGERSYLLEGLTTNPLPNSFRITVSNLNGADSVVAHIKTMNGIEDIKYYKDTVNKLIRITDAIQTVAMVVIAALIVVSVVVVSNTIKLTVVARANEINIMKYVGATNWYIRMPFLIEGMVIGFLSAAVSVGFIALLYNKALDLLGNEALLLFGTPLVPAGFLIGNLTYIFMALGICIGAAGSIVSMRRFLDNRDRA